MSNKIDAVLPLIKSDFERFKILKKSMDLFFKDLGTFWVITPDGDYEEAKRITKDTAAYRVLRESELIPELKGAKRKYDGWFIQQLVKLAIAKKIETAFYLTLDADVICTKPVRYSDIILGGKALTNPSNSDFSPEWTLWAKRVLELPDSGNRYGVTPVLLNRDCVLSLQKYLSYKASPRIIKIANKIGVLSFSSSNYWKSYLLNNFPWTEYRLYYMFIEAKNYFNQYHQIGQLADLTNSVWFREHFLTWDVKKAFEEKNGFFCVIQSKREIKAAEIWEKIKHYIPEDNLPQEI